MRSFEKWRDAQLLAVTVRDPAAFGAWYRRHEREVLAFFRYATRSSGLAADLTAETFAAALESIGGMQRLRGVGTQRSLIHACPPPTHRRVREPSIA